MIKVVAALALSLSSLSVASQQSLLLGKPCPKDKVGCYSTRNEKTKLCEETCFRVLLPPTPIVIGPAGGGGTTGTVGPSFGGSTTGREVNVPPGAIGSSGAMKY